MSDFTQTVEGVGLQTPKCFVYGDITKNQQMEKETSHRPWQTMASAQQATFSLHPVPTAMGGSSDGVKQRNF